MISQVKVVPGISDHEAITFQLDQPSNEPPPNKLQKVYQYHKANIPEINEEINNFTTSFLANNPYRHSVEDNWNIFRDTLLSIVEKHVPHKLLNPYKHLPWLNKNIKLQMNKRKKLYDHARCTQSTCDWEAYKKARNKVNMALKVAHQQYYTYLFDNSYTSNQKRFWSLVKRLRKNYQPVATLHVNDELKTSSISKAEALNQQFYSVFTKEDSNIPFISSPQYPNMPNIVFTTNGIQKLLQDLKPGKSAGPDNIPTWILNHTNNTSSTSNIHSNM